jgi:hypothetical protein
MPTYRYVGPHTDGVEVDALRTFVPHGGTVEVPDDLADAFAAQPSNWEPLKAPKPKTAPTTPTSEED